LNICVESGHSKCLPLPFVAHAVARLRAAQLALLTKPFQARGSRVKRCGNCRVAISHCLCALRPGIPTQVGMCLIMTALETLKPSNTGWLVADVVPNTWAFAWNRTEPDPSLLALLANAQWQPYLVFPGKFVAPERVVAALAEDFPVQLAGNVSTRWMAPGPRPARYFAKAPTWTVCRC
jgi:DTW domain-containing protein